jgi:hypothetical protein
MPITIAEAFVAAGLSPGGCVTWGTKPTTLGSGVYIVSLAESLDSLDGALPRAPLSSTAFERWLNVCPDLTVDGARPTIEELMRRVAAFWLRDEVIVYVGLATSLSSRLRQYYRMPVGARRPHAGGYFLKLLSNLDSLWVHYAQSSDPASAESAIIDRFRSCVSDKTKRDLKDPAHPFPFANLEWPAGVRKTHGIRGATGAPASTPMSIARTEVKIPRSGPCCTQPVTAKDLLHGQIRIPSTGTSSAKSLFPATRTAVSVVLRGRSLEASWDPRMGPERERSGVLRIDKTILQGLIREDERLAITEAADDTIFID